MERLRNRDKPYRSPEVVDVHIHPPPALCQLLVFGGILLAFAAGAAARQASPILERHEGDDYTRYELLAPGSAQFKITYDVTAARAGARYYFNIIRKGAKPATKPCSTG